MSASGEPITFDSGGLTLEGRLHLPAGPSMAAVAVCHPHPLYGGDMNNNVLVALCRALTDAGVAALRFNFRGVGGSQGTHSAGAGERDDAVAALDCLESRGFTVLALAGYSFGAVVALAAGVDARVRGLAAVSPPVGFAPADPPEGLATVLLVTGARDDVAPASGVRERADQLGQRCRVEIIDGADHFWWGNERPLVESVVPFLVGALK